MGMHGILPSIVVLSALMFDFCRAFLGILIPSLFAASLQGVFLSCMATLALANANCLPCGIRPWPSPNSQCTEIGKRTHAPSPVRRGVAVLSSWCTIDLESRRGRRGRASRRYAARMMSSPSVACEKDSAGRG
ncbi:hypothetical protein BDP81DRAFT_92027 [Colletotrichum phormii]|uniref:Uncharacterized protein n=1 Tax=Colletotrichum phormii TaxID=359342 RepID=A0AAJ0A4K8_9PEZI|nr:uncharacterized protein BDP81DRAFT_92027 [Colletotrichum phormii]KAK1654971.1 hypothetical protein BDP81DRAFT_92027 [Colletotrichum phormii]